MKNNKVVAGLVVCLLLLTLGAVFIYAPGAEAASWFSTYTYRKSINVNTTTGNLSNYQINLTVYYGSGTDNASNNTVYLAGKCQSDFDDIVFTSSDGVTLLDYWREIYISGDFALFWIEVSTITEGESNLIYIYYGSASASTLSDPDDTFDYFEDFDEPDYYIKCLDTSSVSSPEQTTNGLKFGDEKPDSMAVCNGSGPISFGGGTLKVFAQMHTPTAGMTAIGWLDESFDSGSTYIGLNRYTNGSQRFLCDWNGNSSIKWITGINDTFHTYEIKNNATDISLYINGTHNASLGVVGGGSSTQNITAGVSTSGSGAYITIQTIELMLENGTSLFTNDLRDGQDTWVAFESAKGGMTFEWNDTGLRQRVTSGSDWGRWVNLKGWTANYSFRSRVALETPSGVTALGGVHLTIEITSDATVEHYSIINLYDDGGDRWNMRVANGTSNDSYITGAGTFFNEYHVQEISRLHNRSDFSVMNASKGGTNYFVSFNDSICMASTTLMYPVVHSCGVNENMSADWFCVRKTTWAEPTLTIIGSEETNPYIDSSLSIDIANAIAIWLPLMLMCLLIGVILIVLLGRRR